MNLLWSPLQSNVAKEICENLNKQERYAAYATSFIFGICAFGIVALVMFGIVFGEMNIFTAIVLLAFLLCILKVIVDKQKSILVNSEYGKSNRYTIEDIEKR